MRILELQKYAEDNGFDSVRFKFIGPTGKIVTCQWLDAYMGLFKVDGQNGFVTVNQFIELFGMTHEFELI
jgi:hypothetical protein